jgi:hypothetical protein
MGSTAGFGLSLGRMIILGGKCNVSRDFVI